MHDVSESISCFYSSKLEKLHFVRVEPTLKLMQNLVGVEGESASVEFVYQRFSDPNIDLVCDDEFLLKQLPTCCVTSDRNTILCGNVLAVGCQGSETVGLTQSQIEIVKRELYVVTAQIDRNLIVLPASHVYQQ